MAKTKTSAHARREQSRKTRVSSVSTTPRTTQNRPSKERARAKKSNSWLFWLIPVAFIVIVGTGIFLVNQGNKSGGTESSVSDSTIQGVKSYDNLTRNHVTKPVTYAQNPPVGGDHNPVWQNCGIYDQPIANENGVHSLEHGAVWITYDPSLPAAQVEKLRALVQGRDYVLLSPYPGLPTPVVATAWGKQLQVQNADDSRIKDFLAAYVQGPQTPEKGAACTGGVGNPIAR